MRDSAKNFLPEVAEHSEVPKLEESEEPSGWGKFLPSVKDPQAVLKHLHSKTYFKSSNEFNLDATDSKIDLDN